MSSSFTQPTQEDSRERKESEIRRTGYSHKIQGSSQTVFLGDLPKDITQLDLYKYLTQNFGECDIVLKRYELKLSLIDQPFATSTTPSVASQT